MSAGPEPGGAAVRRRRRPGGPGLPGWSPAISGSRYEADEDTWWREREVEKIERALAGHGTLGRRELARITRCRSWGPGRFRKALAAAVADGRVERVSWGRYALPGRDRR